jgi:hypothetical protein
MGQNLLASNTAVGRSQRAKGIEESKSQLSLGTSWCWERESHSSIPSHRQASWAGRQSTRSRKLSWGRDCGT